MDHAADFPKFRKLMTQLCETFNRPINDDLVETYWRALRDCSFAAISHRVITIMAKADDTSKFPRPATLRPPEAPSPVDPNREAALARITEANREAWQEALHGKAGERGRADLRVAWLARLQVTTAHSSPARQEIDEDAIATSHDYHRRYMGRT